MNLPKIPLPEHLPGTLSLCLGLVLIVVMAVVWIVGVTVGFPSEYNVYIPVIFAIGAVLVLLEVLPGFFVLRRD